MCKEQNVHIKTEARWGKYISEILKALEEVASESVLGYIIISFISCFPVGSREISVKTFFDLKLERPVNIPIFMFLLPRLIAHVSQPDGNMMSFTLHFLHLT